MSEQPHVGSAAEEAARLFAAIEGWARGRGGAFLDDQHLATGSAACTVCPLCQIVSAARHVRPDAVEHLLDAAASFLAALRSTVSAPAPEGEPRRSDSAVQRIDVREG